MSEFRYNFGEQLSSGLARAREQAMNERNMFSLENFRKSQLELQRKEVESQIQNMGERLRLESKRTDSQLETDKLVQRKTGMDIDELDRRIKWGEDPANDMVFLGPNGEKTVIDAAHPHLPSFIPSWIEGQQNPWFTNEFTDEAFGMPVRYNTAAQAKGELHGRYIAEEQLKNQRSATGAAWAGVQLEKDRQKRQDIVDFMNYSGYGQMAAGAGPRVWSEYGNDVLTGQRDFPGVLGEVVQSELTTGEDIFSRFAEKYGNDPVDADVFARFREGARSPAHWYTKESFPPTAQQQENINVIRQEVKPWIRMIVENPRHAQQLWEMIDPQLKSQIASYVALRNVEGSYYSVDRNLIDRLQNALMGMDDLSAEIGFRAMRGGQGEPNS